MVDRRERSKAAVEARRYFALTFLWTWVFWWAAALLGVEFPEPTALLLYALGGIGPALMASALVYRGYSQESLGQFWLRAVDPRRIPGAWYLLILAAAIAPPLVAKLAPSGRADEAGATAGAAVAIFIVGVLAGLVEEPGWRGYALDRLQSLYSALNASLVLGVIWALWHLPLFFIVGTYQNLLGPGSWQFWLFFVAVLPVSVISTWVYNNTRSSVLAVILLHSFGNAASELLSLEGAEQVVAFAVGLILAVLVAILWGSRTLAREPVWKSTRV